MKTSRSYSLFQQYAGKWVRVSSSSFSKQQAVRVYQSQLINAFFQGIKLELRVIKREE